jgi:hypothetical protein
VPGGDKREVRDPLALGKLGLPPGLLILFATNSEGLFQGRIFVNIFVKTKKYLTRVPT